jgi:hypothetical protein
VRLISGTFAEIIEYAEKIESKLTAAGDLLVLKGER